MPHTSLFPLFPPFLPHGNLHRFEVACSFIFLFFFWWSLQHPLSLSHALPTLMQNYCTVLDPLPLSLPFFVLLTGASGTCDHDPSWAIVLLCPRIVNSFPLPLFWLLLGLIDLEGFVLAFFFRDCPLAPPPTPPLFPMEALHYLKTPPPRTFHPTLASLVFAFTASYFPPFAFGSSYLTIKLLSLSSFFWCSEQRVIFLSSSFPFFFFSFYNLFPVCQQAPAPPGKTTSFLPSFL